MNQQSDHSVILLVASARALGFGSDANHQDRYSMMKSQASLNQRVQSCATFRETMNPTIDVVSKAQFRGDFFMRALFALGFVSFLSLMTAQTQPASILL